MTDTLTLYERVDRRLALIDAIADADGEITPEQEAELAALDASINEKAEACAAKIQELGLTAEACGTEAKRLADRADSLRKRAKWLEGYLLRELTRAGVTKVQGGLFSISRTLNPPRATVTADPPLMRADLDALPEPLRGCVTVKPPTPESYAWDRAALVKLHKDNPDAVAGVAIIERSERVTIR